MAAPFGSEFKVNTYNSDDQIMAHVATDSAGDFVVVWESRNEDGSALGIYAQRYNSSGSAQGSEFRVNTYTTGIQSFPTVAMDSAGDFVIAWQSSGQDGDSYGVYAQRYDSSGAVQGSEFRVNTYTTSIEAHPSVAMDSAGDFVVTWNQYLGAAPSYDVYAQRYNSAGVVQGSAFRINTYTSGTQSFSSVAMDSAGDFVVAWEDFSGEDGNGSGIFAQRYNAAGVVQGSQFRVNTYTSSTQQLPSAAMDSAGDFVIAWASLQDAGGSLGIYAQRYNSSGAVQGSEFHVNTYTSNSQNKSTIAMDSAGDFVVTWNSYLEDGSGYGVYAQAYTASGSAQGSEFRVNTYTTSVQNTPAIAMDSFGDFVIAWASLYQDGSNYGVYAQKYATPHASKLVVSASPTSVSAGGATEVTITAEDSSNNVFTTFSDNVTLSDSMGGASFDTVSFFNGVATLSATLNAVGQQTITASDTTNTFVTAGVSSTLTVAAVAPTQLVITGQPPATIGAGNSFNVTASFEDGSGNVTTNYSGTASIALNDNPGGSTLSGTTMISFTAGVATFSGLSLDKAGGGYTLVATSGTLTSAPSTSISVTAGAATQLVISSVPSSVTSGSPFGFTVTAEDAQGNVDTTFGGSETVALASNPPGGTLSGTLMATASAGVAAFSGLSLDKAGSGYTLAATNGTLTSAPSTSISVTAGAATQLIISSAPSTVRSASPFGFTVTAEDAQGNVDTTFNGSETVALASNPAGGTLGGTLMATASAGVATFLGLSLDKLGGGYTLGVTSGTLTSAPSGSISVTAGVATHLIISSAPSSVVSGSPFGFTVTAEDDQGDVDTTFNGSETVALSSNPAGGTLSGTLMATASAGVATFSGLSIDNVASGYTLGVTSAGLPTAKTGPIQVTPATLIINGSPGDVTTISLSDPTYFSVVIDGGTRTIYNSKNVDKVIYNGPAGAASNLDYDDAVAGQVYTAAQTFSSAVLTRSDGFELDSNDASSLYIYVADPASSATVDAGGGSNGSFFIGAPGAVFSYLSDPASRIYSQLSGFGSETVSGAADGTYAYLYSASHASSVASPTHTTITAGAVTDALDDFRQVYVVGAADGTDTVTFDSAGGEFVGTPQFSYVAGSSAGGNFLLAALYAAKVTAEAAGTSDTASFYSYPGNAFTGAAGNSSLGGTTTNSAGSSVQFFVQAIGYAVAAVYESGAGSDTAQLISSGGGNLISTDTATTLTTGSSTITVNSFFVLGGQILPVASQTAVTGNHDGTDTAYLYDSPGANALVADGSTATLTSSFKSISVDKFGTVYGEAQYGASDTDKKLSALDFALQLVGDWNPA